MHAHRGVRQALTASIAGRRGRVDRYHLDPVTPSSAPGLQPLADAVAVTYAPPGRGPMHAPVDPHQR